MPTEPKPSQTRNKRKKQSITIGYECPSKKHQSFHDAWDSYGVRLLVGAYGSGKSWSCAYEVVDQLCNNPMYAGKMKLARFGGE